MFFSFSPMKIRLHQYPCEQLFYAALYQIFRQIFSFLLPMWSFLFSNQRLVCLENIWVTYDKIFTTRIMRRLFQGHKCRFTVFLFNNKPHVIWLDVFPITDQMGFICMGLPHTDIMITVLAIDCKVFFMYGCWNHYLLPFVDDKINQSFENIIWFNCCLSNTCVLQRRRQWRFYWRGFGECRRVYHCSATTASWSLSSMQ